MKKQFTHVAIILIAILSIYNYSFAGGVYLSESNKKIPNIPVQRALLKYRNGIETLIIESSLNGVKSNYGWIIPIPNLPLKLEKASPGLLKTLSLQLQPKIHYDPPHPKIWQDHDVRLATLYTALVLIGCFIFMRWGAKRSIIPLALIISFMNEPIILEHSPGNVVWAQSGNEHEIKYCRRNGSLTDFPEVRLPFEAPSDIINTGQNLTLTLQAQ